MKNTAALRRRVLDRSARIGIVGQGYVGVSLACAAADAGFPVVGIDVDHTRIAALAEGRLVVAGVQEDCSRPGSRRGGSASPPTSR
jgi:UDP-N-acetyl-D-glucosamine dehydrogenase